MTHYSGTLRMCAQLNAEWAEEYPVADHWPIHQRRYAAVANRSVDLVDRWAEGGDAPEVDPILAGFWWASVNLMPAALSAFAECGGASVTAPHETFREYYYPHREFARWVTPDDAPPTYRSVALYDRLSGWYDADTPLGVLVKHDVVWSGVVFRYYLPRIRQSSPWYWRSLPSTLRAINAIRRYPKPLSDAAVDFVESDVSFWRAVANLGDYDRPVRRAIHRALDEAEEEVELRRQSGTSGVSPWSLSVR